MIPIRPIGAVTKGIALVLLACLIFSTQDTIGKQLMLTMTAFQVIWGRYVVQTAVMTGYLASTSGLRFLKTRHPFLQIARGLAQTVTTGLVYVSLPHVPIGDITALVFCSPILVTLLSVVFLKEKIGRHRIAAVIIGFVGVYLIILPGSGETNFYHILAFLSAFSNATYIMITRHFAGPEEAPATQFNTTAVGLLIFTVILLTTDTPPPLSSAPIFILIGVMAAIGHFSMVKGLSYAPASVLSPYLYSQVLFAALYSVFWFGDSLRLSMVVGTTLLILSGVYIWWRERIRSAESASRPSRA